METTPSKHGTLWEKHIYLTFTNTATYPDQQLRDSRGRFLDFLPVQSLSSELQLRNAKRTCCLLLRLHIGHAFHTLPETHGEKLRTAALLWQLVQSPTSG